MKYALILVTEAIDTIMTGEGIDDKDLVISKLLRQDIQKYRSLFPHVSAAIQSRKYPVRGDTIQYIYTDLKHNNPLHRVTPIENLASLPQYDKEKYKEMILDVSETDCFLSSFCILAVKAITWSDKHSQRRWLCHVMTVGLTLS